MKKLAAVTLVILAQLGGYAIAQDAADPADTKDAEIALKMKLEELEQKELATDKARFDLQSAKTKAITDALPSSTSSGKVDVKEGAGKMEASALTAVALNGLATGIAVDTRAAAVLSSGDPVPLLQAAPCALFEEVQGAPPSTDPAPVLLVMGAEKVSFAYWDQFRQRACKIHQEFIAAGREASKFARVEGAPGTSEVGLGPQAAIAIGSKLLQLAATDWEVGGINVTASDKALAAAVARAYIRGAGTPRARLYWGSQVSKLGGSAPIFKALATLEERDKVADDDIARVRKRVSADQKTYDLLIKVKNPSPWQKAKLAQVKGPVETAAKIVAALTQAKASFAALVKSLAGTTGETALPIGQVINEAAAAQLMGPNGLALNLAVETSGGGYYTRKSFFDSLGLTGLPHHVSGGAVVSFFAVRPADQQVMAAGLFTCNAGYVKISRVAWRTNSAATGQVVPCPTGRSRRR